MKVWQATKHFSDGPCYVFVLHCDLLIVRRSGPARKIFGWMKLSFCGSNCA